MILLVHEQHISLLEDRAAITTACGSRKRSPSIKLVDDSFYFVVSKLGFRAELPNKPTLLQDSCDGRRDKCFVEQRCPRMRLGNVSIVPSRLKILNLFKCINNSS